MFKKLIFFLLPLYIFAAPKNPTVVHGQATFSNQGNNTTINASHNSVINYQGFDIAKNETVQFIQPDSKSRVLNRIDSAMPSQIDGALKANGIVYLVNPAGIMFGKDSVIDVGGILAAAAHISDSDFLNGINRFTAPSGEILNAGKIQAESFVHLIGARVSNIGQIVSGENVSAFTSDEEIFFGQAEGHSFLVLQKDEHKEVINEDDIIGSGDIYSLALENLGTIESKTITLQTAKGQINASGTIKAKDENIGGEIAILADVVNINHAKIDASANNGGGEIYIGGEYRGEGSLPTAQYTYVDPKSVIQANAILEGDGGKVIVWSDNTTFFDGKIAAVGGEKSGNGGFVETSGKKKLSIEEGRVHAHAINGKDGIWLLDPDEIIIDKTYADNIKGSTGYVRVYAKFIYIDYGLDWGPGSLPSSVEFAIEPWGGVGPYQFIGVRCYLPPPITIPPHTLSSTSVPLTFNGSVVFGYDNPSGPDVPNITVDCIDVTFINQNTGGSAFITGDHGITDNVTFNIYYGSTGPSTIQINVPMHNEGGSSYYPNVNNWTFNQANPDAQVNCGDISANNTITTNCAFSSIGTVKAQNFTATANPYHLTFNHINITNNFSADNAGNILFNGSPSLQNVSFSSNVNDITFLSSSEIHSGIPAPLAIDFNNTGQLSINGAATDTMTCHEDINIGNPTVVNLRGTLTTDAKPINITSPLNLQYNALISTVSGAADNSIVLTNIDGAHNLTVKSNASASSFGGNIGSTTPLNGLTVIAQPGVLFSGTVDINNFLIVGNEQVSPKVYYDAIFQNNTSIGAGSSTAVVKTKDLTTSGAANCIFGGTITCTGSASFNNTGPLQLGTNANTATFGGDVSISTVVTGLTFNLASLTTSDTSKIDIWPPLNLTTNTTIANNAAAAGSDIHFHSTIDNTYNLRVNSGQSTTIFDNDVGFTQQLNQLLITASPSILFQGSVHANKVQSYTCPVTFDRGALIEQYLFVTDSSTPTPTYYDLTFNDWVSIGASFPNAQVTARSIQTTGAADYNFQCDITCVGGGGQFDHNGTLMLGAAGQGNTCSFDGNVNVTNATTTLNAALVANNGSVNFANAVTVSAANPTTSVTATGSTGIIFGSTLDGGSCFTVDAGSSPLTFHGAVGGITPLGCLLATGNPIKFNTGTVTASGGTLDFTGPVILNVDPTTFTDTGNTGIIFRNTIDGNVVLNLDAVADITIQGNVGTTARLKDINVVKCDDFLAKATINCDSFTTTTCNSSDISSLITQGRADQDGGDITITSNGSILFKSTVNAKGGAAAAGRDGGNITLTSNGSAGFNPTIEIGSADVSGSNAVGANAGGNSGNITLLPNRGFYADGTYGDFPNARIGLYGTINAKGGSGTPKGSDGNVNLNASGRDKSLSVATIYSTKKKDAQVSIFASNIIMGNNAALTVFGNLNLNATTRINACDIVSVNDMVLTAPIIQIYKHLEGTIIDSKGNKVTNPETHFLAGGNVTTTGALSMVGPGADPMIMSLHLAGSKSASFAANLLYRDIALNFHVGMLNSFSYYSNEAIETAKEPQVDWDLLDEPYELEEDDEENENENNETL